MAFPTLTVSPSLDVSIVLLLICLLAVHLSAGKRPRGTRLPPGPPATPILGNARDMPTHHQCQTFTRWGKQYGDLVYIKVLRQPIIIVNSASVARDLFDKRSVLYSDRSEFPMINDLMGGSWSFVFMRYGERWRKHRKMFHQKFQPAAVLAYQPIQLEQTRVLLRRLLTSPQDFIEHLRHLSGAIIMEVVYGIKVLPKGDPYIRMAEAANSAVMEAGTPGSFLVDSLPILKYIPEWFPGASFRKKARVWRDAITEMRVAPFAAAKRQFETGTVEPSFVASLLEELSHQSDAPLEEEEVIRNAGGVAYGAGADTSATALSWFFLAMTRYPEVQRKAQAEADAVIGRDRLPAFDDQENLPYINALCKEVLRWQPVLPLGVAHRVMEDDVYGDYFIPGGSIVIGNTWSILHDERAFGPNPEEFNPERFLKIGAEEPSAAFGYGRRRCPGRYLADNTMFIAIVSILKLFDITPETHDQDDIVDRDVISDTGFFSRPVPFKCSITPRFEDVERLLLLDSQIPEDRTMDRFFHACHLQTSDC